ncbi:hypothetical protein BDB00DRAFT_794835 [Zychaea mexicana]|uniref:uncharacterized protein n=1 Tax=Zychaea mexicana TaxID=64656 RepID=UPI0022FEDA75|nr:uncharacterized protein BDB00DRAFT_794835 [Zychaea mexicana]KAI9499621.1 hypothetical protein BDB00DRAFT_794835 [Zychaea mexicana]
MTSSTVAKGRVQSIANHLASKDTPDHEKYRVHRKPGQVPYHTPLDPIHFLLRSAMVYRNKTAVIHGDRSFDYETLADRALRLANLLIHGFDVHPGDRVAILCQNIPAFLEAKYAVPAAGAVMVPLNTRLAGPEIEYVVKHSGASVLLVQDDLLPRVSAGVKEAVKMIHVADYQNHGDPPCQYEQLLQNTKTVLGWNDLPLTTDENALISINYTSGSTGKPKGVMASFRGCYMMAVGMCVQAHLTPETVYLWTLPMFHCNGWNFPWALVAVGATQVMLNKLDYTYIWKLIKELGITHYCGAPTVQNEICHHKDAVRPNHTVLAFSGGAPLAPKIIRGLGDLNIYLTQVYGLTETYGPCVLTYDKGSLTQYPEDQHLRLVARQGYNIITQDEVRVLDQQTAKDVVADGMQIGEICLVGNVTMLGYYNDPEETKRCFREGVFWSGDLAVRHPDGVIEIVDRSKDVIVSGGENISSIEVENTIVAMEEVFECAIIAGPDEKWGERPFAYVIVREGRTITAEAIIAHCRKNLAGYKCPAKVTFVDSIPKTR